MPETFAVLIIEDDDDARKNMEDILSLDGYQIESVSHCLPAMTAIENRHFDSIIVDWKLPDGEGGDLIPAIKRELPSSPVIVVTGLREFDTAVKALRTGAYDFLTKPINPDSLRLLFSRLVERKRHMTEIELGHQRLVQNERLAAIGQMVAGLAHESRNAFQRSHACLAELSLDVQEMPDSLKLVHKTQKALDDLNHLLEEVRNYSAPIILERRECNIKSLVEETWRQILEAKQPDSPPEFQVHMSERVPRTWFVDRDRIQQVIRNLIENAYFACKGNGPIVVELAFEDHDHRHQQKLRLSVSDNGEGVPESGRDEIFAPFFTTKTKGTGLGLAIARRIIEAHDGKMFAGESQSGGAKFTVDIKPCIRKQKK